MSTNKSKGIGSTQPLAPATRIATDATQTKKKILYCLDFDGVLCDSASETFQSGWKACKLLWKRNGPSSPQHLSPLRANDANANANATSQQWIDDLEKDPRRLEELLDDFRYVRPILYVGWESILLIRWLAYSGCDRVLDLHKNNGAGADSDHGEAKQRHSRRDAVFRRFHSGLRDHALTTWGLSVEDYVTAFSDARNAWIAQGANDTTTTSNHDATDGDAHGANDESSESHRGTTATETSWIGAHGFYDGACQAVRDYLKEQGNEDLYVITTKGKDFALRLLERQNLFSSATTSTTRLTPSSIVPEETADSTAASSYLLESHVYGLGSGPKASVLQAILDERRNSTTDCVAVMVEDNLATLEKIAGSPVGPSVLRVVASWGYNTIDQVASVVCRNAGNNDDDQNDCIVLPLVRDPPRAACPSDAAALDCARRCKAKDPTGCSLASILQSPSDAGRLLRGEGGGAPSGDDDDDEEDFYDFSSTSNLAESYFQTRA
eukprot:jgi/Psemu1/288873/fgenesh1_pg.295_\